MHTFFEILRVISLVIFFYSLVSMKNMKPRAVFVDESRMLAWPPGHQASINEFKTRRKVNLICCFVSLFALVLISALLQ